MLVDDSSTVLLMQRMIIGEGEFDLVIARNGQEAVQKATQETPNLILMDVLMPIMNGFEACRALRAKESTKEIPIILVTTRGEANNVEEGFAAGCTEYVTKPFDGPELMAKLRNYLKD